MFKEIIKTIKTELLRTHKHIFIKVDWNREKYGNDFIPINEHQARPRKTFSGPERTTHGSLFWTPQKRGNNSTLIKE